jgi:hypothetical protein
MDRRRDRTWRRLTTNRLHRRPRGARILRHDRRYALVTLALVTVLGTITTVLVVDGLMPLAIAWPTARFAVGGGTCPVRRVLLRAAGCSCRVLIAASTPCTIAPAVGRDGAHMHPVETLPDRPCTVAM